MEKLDGRKEWIVKKKFGKRNKQEAEVCNEPTSKKRRVERLEAETVSTRSFEGGDRKREKKKQKK